MKKTTLLIIGLLMAADVAKAQNYDSIAHHKAGWYDIDMRDDMIQLRDGSILAHVQLFEVNEQGQYFGDYGSRFYKISRHGALIMDSVFIEDNDLNWFLLKRNPFDDDNVFAKLVRDMENHRTDLCIRFFDDDLNFKHEKEVWVPVCDTLFPPLCDAYMMDDEGDIILYYPLPAGEVFVKIGLDGTIKQQSQPIPHSSFPVRYYISGQRMGSFRYLATKYAFWGYDEERSLHIIGLDSTLNITEVLTPDDTPQGVSWSYGAKDKVLDWDDNTFFVASRFDRIQNYEDGVRVTRYEKSNLEAANIQYFYTKPVIGNIGCAFPFGLAKSGDGCIYFAYCTQDPSIGSFGNPCGQVSVVKMDDKLNIIWQRFCLELYGYSRVGSDLAVLDNGGVAVGGVVYGRPPEFFFLVFDDEGWNISESRVQVRPYSFYPNPAQSELHLQYSPDVTPTKIELYDLQGRLLQTQSKDLESLNMAGLPAGTYTMRVMLEGGKVFSDKVVKE